MSAEDSRRKTPPRRVVLYGREELARLACYCLGHDSDLEVAGFTVAQAEMPEGPAGEAGLMGLPLVPFETLEERFPPERHDLLIAIGPHQVNAPRAARFAEGRAKGYAFASYLSSRARLWPDLEIGPGCMIFENAVVEPFARIGENSILRANAHVSHDGRIGDHVFLAPRVAMAGKCRVGDHCFLGVNATLRDTVAVAPRCVVGAGAVVAQSTEPDGLYVGVPARRAGPAGGVKVWP
jgi:sugar O-acyltransferase (sialic acid O-acetyltransferase NeuD family)